MSACPQCVAANSFVSAPLPRLTNGSAYRKVVSGILIAIVVVTVIILLSPVFANFVIEQKEDPTITILQPQSQPPKSVTREQLVQHALDMINRDRIKFGLLPVKLSPNQAAQAQAEDVFRTKQISHWNTKGEKPYISYTEYGGKGGMQQNVAIAGFSTEEYKQCIGNILVDCEKIKPLPTVDELQYEMVYNDKECCDNGHRNNILDPRHTDVSIGIVYDDYYLAFVQNFENNYGLNVEANNSKIAISGTLLDGEIDHIAIYYDKMPTREIYEQNKDLLSYSTGELVAMVVKPLPSGYYYKSVQNYNIIEANQWSLRGHSVNVMFNLADVVDKDGVYTIFTVVKNGEEMFDVTSYSVFVNSEKKE